ncbi:MAG: hypothetical protein KF691_06750 [Phycisphaeraceae bacterium]|nr:hypothetical protein [Phycisphaeraceae bacterium]
MKTSTLSGKRHPTRFGACFSGLLLAVGTLIGGCETASKVQGEAEKVIANYKAGTLTATLSATPSQVLAASEQTLRDRGYSIDQNATTKDQGGIFARPPMYNLGRTIRIDVSPTAENSAEIFITTNPWDESLARITLDGILERLGM